MYSNNSRGNSNLFFRRLPAHDTPTLPIVVPAKVYGIQQDGERKRKTKLTKRMQDILRLTYRGVTSVREQAEALDEACSAIMGFRHSLYRKLDVHSLEEAMVVALTEHKEVFQANDQAAD